MRLLAIFLLTNALVCTSARAEALHVDDHLFSVRVTSQSFMAPLASCAATAVRPPRASAIRERETASALSLQDDAQPLHTAAVEHSDAYRTRAKIHKIASFATLPLFAAEVALGQAIYNTASVSSANRSAHIAVGTAIIGLFAVNTVTGGWNMLGEDRQDPNGRTLRLVHSLLMLAADVGFVATSVTGPHTNRRETLTIPTGEATHRALAFSAIGLGTTGYLVMLIGYR